MANISNKPNSSPYLYHLLYHLFHKEVSLFRRISLRSFFKKKQTQFSYNS